MVVGGKKMVVGKSKTEIPREEQLSYQPDEAMRKIGFGEKVGFGFGDLSTNIAWGSMSMFIMFFYTDVIGISAGIIGTIMLFSRFLDGVSDIAMGVIVDRTNTKYGKARPWLLRLAIPFAISLVLVFAVPNNVSDLWKVFYIVVTYNLLVTIFTAVVIPYGTLNTFITSDQNERSTLNVFRMFFANIGLIVVTLCTLPIVKLFGGGQSAWIMTFAIFGILSSVLYFITFKTTKERVQPVKKTGTNKVPIKVGIAALFKNKYWVLTFLTFIVFSLGEATFQGGTIYFATYILKDPLLVGLLSFLILIPSTLGLLFFAPLYKRFGKTKSMIGGSVIFLIGSIVLMIDPSSLTFVVIGSIIRGIGRAGVFGAIWAMLPDAVEYGEWKTGVRNEGLVYSAGSTGQKIGYGIGGALVGWILAWSGYVGGQDIQNPNVLLSIKALFIYLPLLMYVVQIILLSFHKLDKNYPKIYQELQARRNN